MKKPPYPNYGRLMGALMALSVVVLPLTEAPLTASAAQCTLTTNTQSGISCGDPSGSGSVNLPDSGTPSGSTITACKYSADISDLPEAFWSFETDEYYEDEFNTTDGHLTIRTYHDGDRTTGHVEVLENDSTRAYSTTIKNMKVDGTQQVASFDCMLSANGWNFQEGQNPYDHVAGPGTSEILEKSVLALSSKIAPVPDHSGEYLLRLDVDNTASTESEAIVSFHRDEWSSVKLVSSPTDVACGVQGPIEFCQIPMVEAGSTETLVYDVSAASPTATSVPVDFVSMGYLNLKWTAARPATWAHAPVQSQLEVELPL